MTERPTSVYIIECAGYVKIGVATAPDKRVGEISVGTPVKPTLHSYRAFEDKQTAHQIERRMHRRFHRVRANGEWFKVAPAEAWAVLRDMDPMQSRPDSKSHHRDRRMLPENMDEIRAALNAAASA